MLTIAGGLILGGIGLVVAFFCAQFRDNGSCYRLDLITAGRKNG